MQNFKFIGATVSEIRVSKEDEKSVKNMFYLYFVPCGIISCMQLLFDMFSTLMSSEVRLN